MFEIGVSKEKKQAKIIDKGPQIARESKKMQVNQPPVTGDKEVEETGHQAPRNQLPSRRTTQFRR